VEDKPSIDLNVKRVHDEQVSDGGSAVSVSIILRSY
jgi:hypothetical protein